MILGNDIHWDIRMNHYSRIERKLEHSNKDILMDSLRLSLKINFGGGLYDNIIDEITSDLKEEFKDDLRG